MSSGHVSGWPAPTDRPRLQPAPTGRPRLQPDETGQIIPLVIAYALVALTLLVVIVDISAVHLQRNRLFSIADAAAVDAADALDRQSFYRRPSSRRETVDNEAAPVPISDATVRTSVDAYLRRAGPEARLDALAVDQPTGTADGVTAEVTVVGRARLPLFSFVVARWARGVPIRATARARANSPG
jgi:uncharacterized membrane protein